MTAVRAAFLLIAAPLSYRGAYRVLLPTILCASFVMTTRKAHGQVGTVKAPITVDQLLEDVAL